MAKSGLPIKRNSSAEHVLYASPRLYYGTRDGGDARNVHPSGRKMGKRDDHDIWRSDTVHSSVSRDTYEAERRRLLTLRLPSPVDRQYPSYTFLVSF